jgi:hypothetical protein
MRTPKAAFCLLAAVGCLAARADQSVPVCYNYGCSAEAEVRYSEPQLAVIAQLLAGTGDARIERMRIALVIGELYAWAGRQLPVSNDKGGDYADDEVDGRMDCIDHATTTTRLLQVLEHKGWLRFHHVLDPVRRSEFPLGQHFSAVIEEIPLSSAEASGNLARFAVDSWFFDNGTPAAVLPLNDWLRGVGPGV